MQISHVRTVCKLYKAILKMHKGLPEDVKAMGDGYVRQEFRRHKNCSPKESSVFLEEWTKYAVVLSEQLGLKGPKTGQKLGRALTVDELKSMSKDQIDELYKMMLATQRNGQSEKKISNGK